MLAAASKRAAQRLASLLPLTGHVSPALQSRLPACHALAAQLSTRSSLWQDSEAGTSAQVPQSAGLAADTKRKALLNRLRYRSQQRGFLEMDLLVGLWAERHLASMSDAMLAAYEEVLSVENPDLYKWLTGRELAPSELQSNIAFKALLESVQQQLSDNAASSARAEPGQEWVRGWDDWKGAKQQPQQA